MLFDLEHLEQIRNTVRIRKNDCDEYEVPTPGASSFLAGLYFTDDKQDAIDTAQAAHGKNVLITFRNGTYQK